MKANIPKECVLGTRCTSLLILLINIIVVAKNYNHDNVEYNLIGANIGVLQLNSRCVTDSIKKKM